MQAEFVSLLCCIVVVCDGKGHRVNSNVTVDEYYRIPTLFHLDDYDKCMIMRQPTLYCFATIQLSANGTSDTWRIIKDIISVPRFYRHDRLRHGICVRDSCPEIPTELYALGNGSEQLWFAISKCYSQKYEHLGLQGNVDEIHCENQRPIYEVDAVDWLYAGGVVVLLMLIIFGTTYEVYSSYLHPRRYEELTNGSTLGKVVTAFSINKNWKRLRCMSDSEDGKAHEVFQGIRVYNICLVVMCHTVMFQIKSPVYNTRYVEDLALNPMNAFVMHGGVICLTFILMSGWLLAYFSAKMFDNREMKLQHIIIAFINRLLRIWPVLLLSVGFSATWMRHLRRGPFWEHAIGDEFRNCRKNWMWNMLFINNYYETSEMCLQQSWYISTEIQAFVLGLLIMWLVNKNKQHALKIFFTSIIVSNVVSFSYNYYYGNDIVTRAYPEALYTIFLKNESWLLYYAKGHHYFPTYFQGMMSGYYFYYLRKMNKQINPTTLGLFIWFCFIWITPISSILWNNKYYNEGDEYTSFQMASFQMLSRFLFITPINVAILGFVLGIGWRMKSVCAWSPMQTLGRLVFSIYLTHTAVQRTKIVDTLGDIMTSFLIGTIVCLTVELPVSALQKIIFKETKNTDKIENKSD